MSDGMGEAVSNLPRPVLYGAGAVVVLGLLYASRGAGAGASNGGVTVVSPTPDPTAGATAQAGIAARTSAFNTLAGVIGAFSGNDAAGTIARVQGDVSNRQTQAALDAVQVQSWAAVQSAAIAAGASTAQAKITADTAYSIARNQTSAGVQVAGLTDAGATARAQIAADQAKATARATANASITNNAVNNAGGIVDAIGKIAGPILSFFGL